MLMKFRSIFPALLFVALCLVTLNYSPQSTSASAPAAANPFFSESTLPFHAPPFDRIKDSDYAPAIEEGMKDQLAEMENIADDPAPPTVANTFEGIGLFHGSTAGEN